MEHKEMQEILDWIKSELEAKDTRIKTLESAMQGHIDKVETTNVITDIAQISIDSSKIFKELLKQQ